MTDVYLSHAPGDRPLAAALAGRLAQRGRTVFWDLDSLPEDEADDAAEAALAQAGCVVVIWSAAALAGGSWVPAEATEAARRSALIGLLVEQVRPPRKFRKAPTFDLAGWDGDAGPPQLEPLLAAIDEMVVAAPVSARAAGEGPPLVREGAPRVPANLLDGRVAELRGHAGEVYDLSWSPDGVLLATAAADRTAIVWNAKRVQDVVRLTGHTGEVNDVAFGPDGNVLATASDDGSARLWAAGSGKEKLAYRGHSDIVFWVGISPAGDLAASAGADGEVHVWKPGDGQLVWRFSLEAEASTARFLDATVLITADDDGDLVVWDLESGDALAELDVHDGSIADIAVSPTGALVASGSDRGAIAMYNLVDGSMRWWGSDMAGQVYGLAFTPDGRLLAATDDEGVTLFRSDDGEVLDVRADPGATRLEFSPTGPALAVASGEVVKVVTPG